MEGLCSPNNDTPLIEKLRSIELAGSPVSRKSLINPPRTLHYQFQTGHDTTIAADGEIPSKIPNTASKTLGAGLVYFVIFFITVSGLVYGMTDTFRSTHIDWDVTYNVGFLGNAYLFVNDVPRLLEAISTGHVYQNSVLHFGSLSDLWMMGNGMYSLWATEEAEIWTDYNEQLYDFGYCTVAQLLQGYDEYLDEDSNNYYDDGQNPCLQDADYLSFINSELQAAPVTLDYVVLADQTKRLAIESARNKSIAVLVNGYAQLLQASGAVPVLIDTHAFWSDNSNMTGLSDIPTFTKLITAGVEAYQSALSKALPRAQRPIICRIGLAYLVVWEEDYELWQKLFLDDQIHSSIYGSYLFGTVLYSTLFGHLPDSLLTSHIPSLFADARKLVGSSNIPNGTEAEFLRNVARRVVLGNHRPRSLNKS